MNSSDAPSRITKAFGVNGLKNTIPIDSSTSTDNNGVATFDKGFPPITMQPLSAGGIPPSGKDMNGALYSVTQQQQWYNAGMTYPYSQGFADAINGYPKGAIAPSSVLTGQWLNLNEGNASQPESPNGASTGWVPINNYGVTQITMTSGSIVMSSLQAAKDRIIISGAITANVNLIFPAWIKSWVVHNNCTGNFTITCRTAAGSGITVIPGLVSRLFCDGLNISDDTYNPNNDMVGMLACFAMNSAPEGWLIADGSVKSRVTYARLFSRIGTLYGVGDGVTTFNLPDARGVVLRGADLESGRDTGRVFGSYQDDAVKTIDLNFYGSSGTSGNRNVFAVERGISAIYTNAISQIDGSSQPAFRMNGAIENRVKNISVLNCIKY